MPIEGADLEVQLAEAVRNIHGNMAPAVDVDAELDDVPAVSYTHLDVYKRQP